MSDNTPKKEGITVLTLEGDRGVFLRLKDLFDSGELKEVAGFPILSIEEVPDEVPNDHPSPGA